MPAVRAAALEVGYGRRVERQDRVVLVLSPQRRCGCFRVVEHHVGTATAEGRAARSKIAASAWTHSLRVGMPRAASVVSCAMQHRGRRLRWSVCVAV